MGFLADAFGCSTNMTHSHLVFNPWSWLTPGAPLRWRWNVLFPLNAPRVKNPDRAVRRGALCWRGITDSRVKMREAAPKISVRP